MRSYVQVLSTGTSDPALLLFFDRRRYLFNAPEGLQRLFSELKAKITKCHTVFLTSFAPTGLCGLPGAVLALADSSVERVDVVGPGGTLALLSSAQSFLYRDRLTLGVHEVHPSISDHQADIALEMVFHDDVITAYGATLQTAVAETVQLHARMSHKGMRMEAHGCSVDDSGMHAVPIARETAVAYAIVLPDGEGTLNIQRARELGVPTGPMLGQLKRGDTVTTPDGRIVTPAECVEGASPGGVLAVLPIPSKRHIASAQRFLHALGSSGVRVTLAAAEADPPHKRPRGEISALARRSLVLCCIIAPACVLADVRVRELAESIGRDRTMLCPSGMTSPSRVFRSAERVQAMLHQLCPPCFPATWEHGRSTDTVEIIKNNAKFILQSTKKHTLGVDEQDCPPSGLADIEEAQKDGATAIAAASATEAASTLPRFAAYEKPEYPVLYLLGTGSACPSKYRNASGIVLDLSPDESVFLDTGEDSLGQLIRTVGVDEAEKLVARMSVLWISHIHADHHLGALRILELRRAVCDRGKRPPLVCGPPSLLRFITQYAKVAGAPLFELCTPLNIVDEPRILVPESDVEYLDNVPVEHCYQAYGLVLEHRKGWKFVYSGDTRPCDALVKAGKGAKYVLHEATMDDELLEEAVAKRHSTISEAVHVIEQINPAIGILTHFSQRYPKVPLIDDRKHKGIAIGFDTMRLSLDRDGPRLAALLPVFGALFEEEGAPQAGR